MCQMRVCMVSCNGLVSDRLEIHHDPDQVKVVTEEYLKEFAILRALLFCSVIRGDVIKNKDNDKSSDSPPTRPNLDESPFNPCSYY